MTTGTPSRLAASDTISSPTPRAGMTLLAAALGFFMITLDASVVNVALPTIGRQFGGGITGLQWVVGGYTLAFAALLLSAGALSDRLGASRCFAAGLTVFTLASAGCGLAPTLPALLAARVVQGAAAALMMPASLALIRQAYQQDTARARAIATWTAAGGAAVAAGPVFGGVLTSGLGWRTIFFINIPAGAAALMTLTRAPRSSPRPVPLDPAGQIAAVTALVALTFAVIEAGQYGWTSPVVAAALAGFVLAAAAFVLIEARTKNPMVPLGLFRSRAVSVTAVTGLVLNLTNYGLIFVMSLYFQQIQGRSVLTAGLMFIPMTALITVANLTAGRLTARYGPRLPLVGGQLLQVIGYLALIGVGPHTSTTILLTLLIPIGIGGGLSVPPLTSTLLQAISADRAGTASGVLSCARQTGGALGVALFGALIAGEGDATFLTGLHTSAVIATAALLATSVATLTLIRTTRPAGL
ncbi:MULTISPECIES: MFS transporter [Thermomonosporaceae]|uniref:MFS transporter n=1 Tax=Thermomonosporaceae TaxID=2012 RepID=UPI00255AE80F|nr:MULTISPECIES: MFS transporter [Thermomonosporaceae]MDL4774851.1 MFS transporter [Actinomadura xylanilytica]